MIFGIVIVGAFFILILLPDGGGTGEATFRIPSLSIINTTATSATAIPVGEIFCKVRQTTTVFSNTGAVIQVLSSDTVQGSPFVGLQFTFDPQTMAEVSYFVITPKVFCTQENNVPIQVTFPNGIGFSVGIQSCPLNSSEGQRGATTCTGNNVLLGAGVQSATYFFGSDQPETDITHFVIKITDIEKTIGDVDLSAKLTFTISGDMKVAYRDTTGCPNCSQFTYDFYIPPKSLTTSYNVIILKAPPPQIDTDNDGIIDSFDSCPTSPETYNGFEDGDGCPDTRPPDLTSTTTTIVDETMAPIDTSTELMCRDTAIGVDDPNARQICIDQCASVTNGLGTWTDTIGIQTSSFGFVWNNGKCAIEDTDVEVIGVIISIEEEEPTIIQSIIEPIQQIIETLSEPTIAEVTVEQITEPTIEPTVEPITTTQPSVTTFPPPITITEPEPTFELQQEIPPPQQVPVRETIEIRPPMEDESFTLVIIILIILGLAGIVIASRFRIIKI